MKKVLFDSREIDKIYEDVLRHSRERFGVEPKEQDAWSEAFELQEEDHMNLVGRVEDANLKLIFFGTLGLWNGRVIGYTVRDSGKAFYGSRDTKDILIESDDKDIWVTEFHHDGSNVMCVRALKDLEDVSEEDQEFLQSLLKRSIYLKKGDTQRVERVSASILHYFKEDDNEKVTSS